MEMGVYIEKVGGCAMGRRGFHDGHRLNFGGRREWLVEMG
jgi:hypothetical protein